MDGAALPVVVAGAGIGGLALALALQGAGVPVVVLGWSHKYREVMARFDQEHRVMDWRDATTDRETDGHLSVLGPFDARFVRRHQPRVGLKGARLSIGETTQAP